MHFTIAAVGKLKDTAEREICDRYVTRFIGVGRPIGLGPLDVLEFPEARSNSRKARKTDEAARLLRHVRVSDYRVSLDVAGKAMTSEAFAALLGRQRDGGTKQIAILIGGPDGHGSKALSEAHLKLSLGPMTFPHGLARVILLEQLYRAATILSGHPYHRS